MHENATLLTAGGAKALTFEEGKRFVAGVKRAIPDISRWVGINRNTLDGAKSRGAISCWDRHSLIEQVDPSRPRLDLGAELARLAEASKS